MLLAQPRPGCTIGHEGEYIRAQVGPARRHKIRECYRALAALTLEHEFSRALIVGLGADDRIDPLAVRDAVIAFQVIGVPASFRLALVPHTAEALNRFRDTETEGANLGLRVKLFADEVEAVRWLTAPELH